MDKTPYNRLNPFCVPQGDLVITDDAGFMLGTLMRHDTEFFRFVDMDGNEQFRAYAWTDFMGCLHYYVQNL